MSGNIQAHNDGSGRSSQASKAGVSTESATPQSASQGASTGSSTDATSAAPSLVGGLWTCPIPNPGQNVAAASLHYSFGSDGSARYLTGDDQADAFVGTYTYRAGKLRLVLDVLGKTTVEVDTITWADASTFHVYLPPHGPALTCSKIGL